MTGPDGIPGPADEAAAGAGASEAERAAAEEGAAPYGREHPAQRDDSIPQLRGDRPPPRRAVVITCSTRAAQGVYEDRGGPAVVHALQTWGLDVDGPVVVPDGPEVGRALRAALDKGVDLVVTTGGTGLSPTDVTPELTSALVDRPVPGIIEAMRAHGHKAGTPTAMLSRGVAGLAGRTLVINLPGSRGGVLDGLSVLEPVLSHALAQAAGEGDHR